MPQMLSVELNLNWIQNVLLSRWMFFKVENSCMMLLAGTVRHPGVGFPVNGRMPWAECMREKEWGTGTGRQLQRVATAAGSPLGIFQQRQTARKLDVDWVWDWERDANWWEGEGVFFFCNQRLFPLSLVWGAVDFWMRLSRVSRSGIFSESRDWIEKVE